MVVLPNSQFLSSLVVNETFTERFALHTTRIELDADTPRREAEAMLLEAASDVCGSYVDDALGNDATRARIGAAQPEA